MSQADFRLEVLDLLARGKITIDEAERLLDQTGDAAAAETEPVTKAQAPVETAVLKEKERPISVVEELAPARFDGSGSEPRWLRIRVGDLDTGRDKVTVNIPFGMVKFGMGMARMFGGEKAAQLGQWEEMIATAGTGVLVDVEDEESNEHVRIYVE